jgi:hypothetical protein
LLYEIRLANGGVNPDVKGTLIWPEGTQQLVTEDDFVLTPTGSWTRPTYRRFDTFRLEADPARA